MNVSYCDAIAHVLTKLMKASISGAIEIDLDGADKVIKAVSPVKLDLSPDGSYLSNRKQFMVADINGQTYTVTIQEAA